MAALIQRHKDDCEGPGAAVCQSVIEEMGYSYDEYWRVSASYYREALLLIQVYADLYAQSHLDPDATEDEVWAAREFLGLKVQAAATIEW